MEKKEIITKALCKAQAGGYDYLKLFRDNNITYKINDRGDLDAGKDGYAGFEIIIFHHAFAKAFWGEEPLIRGRWERLDKEPDAFGGEVEVGGVEYGNMSPWQYHLQQIVLEKEPLKYLEKFL